MNWLAGELTAYSTRSVGRTQDLRAERGKSMNRPLAVVDLGAPAREVCDRLASMVSLA